MAELIRLGAYRRGSDPAVDEAIHYYEPLERYLSQEIGENASLEDGYKQLYDLLGMQGDADGSAGDGPEAQTAEG